MMSKGFITISELFVGIGEIINFIITAIFSIAAAIRRPFSIEKKDGKLVFSVTINLPEKKDADKKIDVKALLDIIKIKKSAENSDYLLMVKLPRLGYICMHLFPTRTSGVYAYLSPNERIITATWYAGMNKKERIAAALVRNEFGHGYRVTECALGKILNMRASIASNGVFKMARLALPMSH